MNARRRRRHEPDEEHENDERWMASYMDMVTVLMCMFIVLFAMSTVDQKKFAELKDSLATGFGQVKSQKIDTASGVIVPPAQVDDTGKNTDLSLAQVEVDNLKELRDRILAALGEDGLQDAVTMKIDERGLTIGLVGNETFFASNRAELSAAATVGPQRHRAHPRADSIPGVGGGPRGLPPAGRAVPDQLGALRGPCDERSASPGRGRHLPAGADRRGQLRFGETAGDGHRLLRPGARRSTGEWMWWCCRTSPTRFARSSRRS